MFQFLTKNPAKRLGSENEDVEIRTHPFFKRIDWVKMESREIQPPSVPKLVINTFVLNFLTLIAATSFV